MRRWRVQPQRVRVEFAADFDAEAGVGTIGMSVRYRPGASCESLCPPSPTES